MVNKKFAEGIQSKHQAPTVEWGEAVTADFLALHDALAKSKTFDEDALAHLADFSKNRGVIELPIALSAYTNVIRDATRVAIEEKNPTILNLLDALESDISGLGKDRAPVKVSPAKRER